jgi:hypothetical protein
MEDHDEIFGETKWKGISPIWRAEDLYLILLLLFTYKLGRLQV